MRHTRLLMVAAAILLPAIASFHARGQDMVRISEFQAINDGPLLDEDGEASDWVEIHNAGTNTVNLDGWYLTDRANDLTKWRFPATNVPPNGYLLVFASGKDHRTLGAPLHANFSLNNGGEYLGLIRPDGVTVASAYAPVFPGQVAGISYGVPLQQIATTLLTTGTVARVLVPSDGALGDTWTGTNFNDAGWIPARLGVGYETDGQVTFVSVLAADSVQDFSGVQGWNNWFYGYWDKGTDANGVYADTEFTAFPNLGGPFSETNSWNGTSWAWYDGNPPWTSLWAAGGHPSGNNGGSGPADHWTVRRWIAETNGPFKISGRLEHRNENWVYVTQTGVAANSTLYLYLTAAGDGYIDDLKLVAGPTPEAGANLLPNGDFESTFPGSWTVSANHSASAIVTNVVHGGSRALRMVASVGGTTQASAIWQNVSPALTVGQTYTLSYWFRPGTNYSPFVARFSGNWINTSPVLCGDGTIARIFVDGAPVYSRTIFMGAVDYSVEVGANAGSRIDFVLDAGAANNDFCDSTTFTAKLDTVDPAIAIVADSVADWSLNGVQGEKNWFYGYYNKTAFPTYRTTNFIAFPKDNGPYSPNNYWNGTAWNWFAGDPPWDEIGPTYLHPNGVNSVTGGEHWVIRRWVSEVSGRITVDWTLAKQNPAGNGVTGLIFHNAQLRDSNVVAGADSVGISRSVTITNVQVGDFIDIVLTPVGVGATTDDSSDGSYMTAVIRGAPSLTSQIMTNLASVMKGVNASAYVRVPFVVTNASALTFLTLRMKYDDGFVAYLNGVGVASRNGPVFPDLTVWNSAAIASRNDADAVQFEDFDLTQVTGLLREGTNFLALQGLNASANDSDFLVLPELRATSLVSDVNNPRYFTSPTPGAANGLGNTNVGPLIKNLAHTPNVPLDGEDLYVTARVIPTFNTLSNVTLTYRVMFSNEVSAAMFDDGAHADGLAGDGVFGGVIPANASSPDQMVRYYVSARDVRTNFTRLPANANASVAAPLYQGTVVYNPASTSALPVLHWFIQNPTGADGDAGARGSLFFDGEFYDNIYANVHGQSTRGFPKHSYDFDMNPGYKFRWSNDEIRVDDFNLLSTWADKAHMRTILGYETWTRADSPAHFAFMVRVQQNGAFFAVANFVENGDDNFLKREGLDPNGALYKMYNTFTGIGDTTISVNAGAEKKTRKYEGNADLVALFNGINQPNGSAALAAYLYDNVNVPEVINFLAAMVVAASEDCCHKNYYFYRDTEITGEWHMMPWDTDLSYGRTWTSANNYFDTRIFATNFYSQTTMDIGSNNRLPAALHSIPAIRQMYLRRIKTLTDEILQPPGLHPLLYKLERRIDEIGAVTLPDAALDLAKWGSWAPIQDFATATGVIKSNYLALRRPWIYGTLSVTNGGPYMASQPTNAAVNFGTIDYNPISGKQAEEYIQLVNTNNYPVDISGWQIKGAINYTFRGGVILSTNGILYVSPDVRAFRARATAPRGGQGLFVQGGYEGRLSARGESLQLVDRTGRIVRTVTTTATPSPAQQYLRITEIMYHPAPPPPGLATNEDEFEYIELKNTGPASLSLLGVHFGEGIEFGFTGSSVTNLGAGESTVVVRNLAAFTSRYGGGVPRVAGQYSGALDNNGETLRLEDASNEKILEFRYENSWYQITDGFGFSLLIVNETAPWDTWGDKASWRPSGAVSGSPGETNSVLGSIPGVLINEVLTHTDPPQVDAVELFNPTSNDVVVGGWFLTDDFRTPRKYRIPDGTNVPAGGLLVLTENEFNPGGAGFSFSSHGDEVYLFSGDAATNLTGYYHGFEFGASANGVSFGRHVTSVGAEHFVAQSMDTLTNANAGPRVGPLVVSEIMFHPPDRADGSDNSDDEFIEFRNVAGTNVNLFDPAFATNTWRVRGGVDFNFPTGIFLGPGSNLLVVSFDITNTVQLAAFRAKYGVPGTVQVLGPYQGKLDNSSESVRLERPDSPDPGGVPYILVDRVDYSDDPTWPEGADGTGAALLRRMLTDYGNDPANWTVGTPTAGADATGGIPPSITAQPQNRIATAYNAVTFTVGASGTGLHYQWARNDENIFGATNADYTINSVPPFSDAVYRVAVYNDAGVVLSSNATLQVILGAVILQQPQSRTAFPSNNVTFNVVAASSSSLTYQWRLNGMNISGATGSSLNLTNIQPASQGDYTVVVSDAVGPVTSAAAHLTVLLQPLITTQPTNRLVVLPVSSNITFVVVAQSGTPLRYQWQFNGTNISGGTNATLILSNVQTTAAGTYRVAVSDSFGITLSNPAELSLVVRPTITLHPINQTAVPGGSATFTVEATGTEPLWFRWRRAGVTVSGANFYILSNSTSSALTIISAGIFDATNYTVVVTNVAGQAPVSQQGILTLLVDTDLDGLPDSWETNQVGFNPMDPSDGVADTDGDGMSNAAEYLAGTDYLDGNSFLKVNIAPGGPATIWFYAVSNRSYTVQSTDDLKTPMWRRFTDVLVRTNSRIEAVVDPRPGTNRHYRLTTPVRP